MSLQYMNGYTTTTTNGKGTAFAGTVMGLNGTAMKKYGSVRPETVGYKVYLYDPSDKEYKLLETIRDVDTCSYQYTGNASIEMDENGNFIFTLTDGSKMKMNVGKVESTVSIPASASIGENSLDEMQMRLDKLEKQAEKKAARDKLVYVALALSVLSLLWNATTLITELMKKKREEEK